MSVESRDQRARARTVLLVSVRVDVYACVRANECVDERER